MDIEMHFKYNIIISNVLKLETKKQHWDHKIKDQYGKEHVIDILNLRDSIPNNIKYIIWT